MVEPHLAPSRKSNKGAFVERRDSRAEGAAEGSSGDSGYFHLLTLKTQVRQHVIFVVGARCVARPCLRVITRASRVAEQ